MLVFEVTEILEELETLFRHPARGSRSMSETKLVRLIESLDDLGASLTGENGSILPSDIRDRIGQLALECSNLVAGAPDAEHSTDLRVRLSKLAEILQA